MRLLPRSLFGQIVLALVAGIVVAQLAGAWLLLDDRSRFGDRLRREYAAQRIAGIITVLDAAPAEERPRLVRALSVPPTRLTLDEAWQASGASWGPMLRCSCSAWRANSIVRCRCRCCRSAMCRGRTGVPATTWRDRTGTRDTMARWCCWR